MQLITNYIDNLNKRYKTGISREHTYRGDLQQLLECLLDDVLVTNEPARIECGSPDYILTQSDIPLGYIEAKDIGKSLDSKDYKEQFDRYRKALSNLIITDYIQFRFYRDGELVTTIEIAEIDNEHNIVSLPENFQHFANLIKDFRSQVSQTIKSPTKLSTMMASKARLLANIIENALNSDVDNEDNSSLKDQMEAFKNILIHDITNSQFADVYAQTIAYGMFAARLHDDTLPTFSRQEAAELIPKSNPFLRKLFQYIAGIYLDDRIKWIVDALADIFRATDIKAILNSFGKSTRQQDPMIHFYETFLAEYDPNLRKSRGVWYTPEPIVKFIVRAVDDILKSDFNLLSGLADTSKTKITLESQVRDGRTKSGFKQFEKDVHKVQILDPAAGTGTFLAETIKYIYTNNFSGIEGAWSNYVEQDLIPRINGFEILMASYAMAHLKLELLLDETGYRPTKQQRLNVYLTNSLEEAHPDTGTLFASWLSKEASDANHIKRDSPVMVVMGNPPYSISSVNKGEWIQKLIQDYKKGLGEKKINLDDDYIKFIRYGQEFVQRNGEGVLAYISNNSFLDGITHRQMRKDLLDCFDKIYILDLHGSKNRRETASAGGDDENVFDIQQGVSINLFVKTSQKASKGLGEVYHYDLVGRRQEKYHSLDNLRINQIKWEKLNCLAPEYFFVPKNLELREKYTEGFSVNELFTVYSSGIQTKRDKVCISFTEEELNDIKDDFRSIESTELRKKYQLPLDGRDWKLDLAKSDLLNQNTNEDILYRPFDVRKTVFTGNSKGFLAYPRTKIMQNFISVENVGLIFERSSVLKNYTNFFISNSLVDLHVLDTAYANGYVAPLYVFHKQNVFESTTEKTPNFDKKILSDISESLCLEYRLERTSRESFTPIDVMDYVYAVLHSPIYRNTYIEFLKIDFPRIPYPRENTFWELVELGAQLRKLHLLDSELLQNFVASFPLAGDNIITRKMTKTSPAYQKLDESSGRVWINDQQYFDNVPLIAWELHIGGYQPAQKWLKDRVRRVLSTEEIRHYLKVITALVETNRVINEIGKIEI